MAMQIERFIKSPMDKICSLLKSEIFLAHRSSHPSHSFSWLAAQVHHSVYIGLVILLGFSNFCNTLERRLFPEFRGELLGRLLLFQSCVAISLLALRFGHGDIFN